MSQEQLAAAIWSGAEGGSLDSLAVSATTHCLTGCAIGEIVGFVIAFPFAFWANRYMIARGKGHAVVHAHHEG
jgi:hypothetical protein